MLPDGCISQGALLHVPRGLAGLGILSWGPLASLQRAWPRHAQLMGSRREVRVFGAVAQDMTHIGEGLSLRAGDIPQQVAGAVGVHQWTTIYVHEVLCH